MSSRSALPVIVFVALQTGKGANGGIASLGEIMRGLQDLRPVLLTNLETKFTRGCRAFGIEVHVVPEAAQRGWRHAPFAAAVSYVRYTLAVFNITRRTRARVIHANDPLAFQMVVGAARLLPNLRLVLNIRDTLDPYRAPPQRRYRALFKAADHVLMLSHDMVERWNEIVPGLRAKASATYSVVDHEAFAPQPLSEDLPRVVLVSGVVSEKKGQLEYLTKVAPHLAQTDIETWFVGDFDPEHDSYARACAEAARPLGTKVRFLGYQADMPGVLARAHVLAVPSRYEGLMRSMIEAMSEGRPVVSTDVASANEMLSKPGAQAGMVIPIDEIEQMAPHLIRLTEDEDYNRQLGAAGATLARKYFDRAAVVERYAATYRALIGGKSNAKALQGTDGAH